MGRDMPALSNARHERFAQEVAGGATADEAYEAAGYRPNRGNAARLKANENIRARVAEIIDRGAQRAEITVERTLAELGRVGFSDIRKAFTPGGSLLPPEEWDDDFAASVAGVEVVTRPTGEKDENGLTVVEHVHKFRLWDKNSALEKIAKHLGMFVERHEHSSPDGSMTPRLVVSTMTPREAAEAYEASLGSDG